MNSIINEFSGMDFRYGATILFFVYMSLVMSFSYVTIDAFGFLIKSLYHKYRHNHE